jgi:hypothetical protein
MPDRQRDVVKPPNESDFKGDCRTNGFLPLSAAGSPVTASNLSRFMHGDAGGSADLARHASPVVPANAKLVDGDPGYTPLTPAAVKPGNGAVPVNPFLVSGPGLARAMPIADDADGPRGSFPSRLK